MNTADASIMGGALASALTPVEKVMPAPPAHLSPVIPAVPSRLTSEDLADPAKSKDAVRSLSMSHRIPIHMAGMIHPAVELGAHQAVAAMPNGLRRELERSNLRVFLLNPSEFPVETRMGPSGRRFIVDEDAEHEQGLINVTQHLRADAPPAHVAIASNEARGKVAKNLAIHGFHFLGAAAARDADMSHGAAERMEALALEAAAQSARHEERRGMAPAPGDSKRVDRLRALISEAAAHKDRYESLGNALRRFSMASDAESYMLDYLRSFAGSPAEHRYVYTGNPSSDSFRNRMPFLRRPDPEFSVHPAAPINFGHIAGEMYSSASNEEAAARWATLSRQRPMTADAFAQLWQRLHERLDVPKHRHA